MDYCLAEEEEKEGSVVVKCRPVDPLASTRSRGPLPLWDKRVRVGSSPQFPFWDISSSLHSRLHHMRPSRRTVFQVLLKQ
jgi:hypothetical protein